MGKCWVDGDVDSLVKWDKVACNNSQDYWQWHFLQAMNEGFCSLLTHKYVSIGCYPCTKQNLLLEELLSSKCLWEDLKDQKHGTQKGYTKLQVIMPSVLGHLYVASYSANCAIIYRCLIYLSVNAVQYLLLLYASWYCFSQAVAVSYAKQAVKLVDNKELNVQNLGASSCTILLFLIYEYDPDLPLDVTVRKEISLMAFIKAH